MRAARGLLALALSVSCSDGTTSELDVADPIGCGFRSAGSRGVPEGECVRFRVPAGGDYAVARSEGSACEASGEALTCIVLVAGESVTAWMRYAAEPPNIAFERAQLGTDGTCPLVCE